MADVSTYNDLNVSLAEKKIREDYPGYNILSFPESVLDTEHKSLEFRRNRVRIYFDETSKVSKVIVG